MGAGRLRMRSELRGHGVLRRQGVLGAVRRLLGLAPWGLRCPEGCAKGCAAEILMTKRTCQICVVCGKWGTERRASDRLLWPSC